jgi:hypothetical protein
MATTFNKSIQPLDGNWIVTFSIASKDPDDYTLAQQYGDLDLEFANKYVDPLDNTFSFTILKSNRSIWSDILLNKLPNIEYKFVFDDASIVSATRYRQAVIYANTVQAALIAALTVLRAMPATPPVTSTFTV